MPPQATARTMRSMEDPRPRRQRSRRFRRLLATPREALVHRRLQREPETDPHRGWLAQHGGHPRPEATPAEPSSVEETASAFPLTLAAGADVERAVREDAETAVRRVSRFAPHAVLHGRISLERRQDPAVRLPAVVRASLELRGAVVRAEAAGRTFADAVDLLERRLRRRLERIGELSETRRHRPPPGPPDEGRRNGR